MKQTIYIRIGKRSRHIDDAHFLLFSTSNDNIAHHRLFFLLSNHHGYHAEVVLTYSFHITDIYTKNNSQITTTINKI